MHMHIRRLLYEEVTDEEAADRETTEVEQVRVCECKHDVGG